MPLGDINDVLPGIVSGETVLVEYPSDVSPELFLLALHRYARERGFSFIVDDILDTFPGYITRLKLRGVDVSDILRVPVIKIGGTQRLGDVKGTIDVDHHSLDFRYYERVYRESKGSFVINPVVGFHKFFITLKDRELLRLIRNVAGFVGRRDRIAFYLLNSDIAEVTYPGHLALMREVSTTLIRLEKEGSETVVRIIRSVNPKLEGVTVVF